MGLEMVRINHDHFGLNILDNQLLQDAGKYAHLAPTKSAVAEGLLQPCARTVPKLLWALIASGRIQMRKIDGWQTLAQPIKPITLDLVAYSDAA